MHYVGPGFHLQVDNPFLKHMLEDAFLGALGFIPHVASLIAMIALYGIQPVSVLSAIILALIFSEALSTRKRLLIAPLAVSILYLSILVIVALSLARIFHTLSHYSYFLFVASMLVFMVWRLGLLTPKCLWIAAAVCALSTVLSLHSERTQWFLSSLSLIASLNASYPLLSIFMYLLASALLPAVITVTILRVLSSR